MEAGWIPVPSSERTGLKTAGLTAYGMKSRKFFQQIQHALFCLGLKDQT